MNKASIKKMGIGLNSGDQGSNTQIRLDRNFEQYIENWSSDILAKKREQAPELLYKLGIIGAPGKMALTILNKIINTDDETLSKYSEVLLVGRQGKKDMERIMGSVTPMVRASKSDIDLRKIKVTDLDEVRERAGTIVTAFCNTDYEKKAREGIYMERREFLIPNALAMYLIALKLRGSVAFHTYIGTNPVNEMAYLYSCFAEYSPRRVSGLTSTDNNAAAHIYQEDLKPRWISRLTSKEESSLKEKLESSHVKVVPILMGIHGEQFIDHENSYIISGVPFTDKVIKKTSLQKYKNITRGMGIKEGEDLIPASIPVYFTDLVDYTPQWKSERTEEVHNNLGITRLVGTEDYGVPTIEPAAGEIINMIKLLWNPVEEDRQINAALYTEPEKIGFRGGPYFIAGVGEMSKNGEVLIDYSHKAYSDNSRRLAKIAEDGNRTLVERLEGTHNVNYKGKEVTYTVSFN